MTTNLMQIYIFAGFLQRLCYCCLWSYLFHMMVNNDCDINRLTCVMLTITVKRFNLNHHTLDS